MDFSFTEEQSMLRDTVASYLADHYAFDQRKGFVKAGPGTKPPAWKALAEELGILGAAFPEDLGGLGGGPVETMIIMEEFGKALVVDPYVGTVVIAGGFLKHSGHPLAAELIGRIIAGEEIYAFAYAEPQGRYNLADLKTAARREGDGWVLDGMKAAVVGAPWAGQLIVTARTSGGRHDAEGISVFRVDKAADGVTTRDYPTVDGSWASDVWLEGVRVGPDALIGPEDHGLPLVEKVLEEAVAATCAEACGVLRRLQEGTVEYTRQRRQFGQPISNFQVLKHRMVDMFIHLEEAISMTYMATLRLDDPAERARGVAAAKARIGKACTFVGQNAIQLHGGLGITEEMAIGHYFKRATLIEMAFGDTDHHLRRYEFLAFGQAA